MARPTIALQLYTLRDLTRNDIAGVLKQVGEMGYEGVEPAGYGNLDALTIKRVLDDNGLKVVGNHVGFEALDNSLQSVIDDNLLLDNRYIVCPSIPAISAPAPTATRSSRKR
jgi:sugar phosphate isomerase/epimerase